MYMCVCVYIYIYIYIYNLTSRLRQNVLSKNVINFHDYPILFIYIYIHTYIYIYIHICIYICKNKYTANKDF